MWRTLISIFKRSVFYITMPAISLATGSRIGFVGLVAWIIYVLSGFVFEFPFFDAVAGFVGRGVLALAVMVAVVSYVNYRIERRSRVGRVDPSGKAVLITGCDTGFGFETALRLYCSGFQVYAGCLHPDTNGAQTLAKVDGCKRLVPLQLDVREQSQVDQVFGFISSHLQANDLCLWAVINNAGVCSFCELEFCSVATYQNIIDTNSVGVVRMTKAFLPLLRASQGRVIMISSLAGLLSYPGLTAYCMSKHAITALADVLRKEFRKWKIHVATVEATGYRTEMLNPSKLVRDIDNSWNSATDEVRAAYGPNYYSMFRDAHVKRLTAVDGNIGEAVDTIVTAVESSRVRDRYFTSFRAEMRALGRFLPSKWQDWYMVFFESFEPLFSYFFKIAPVTDERIAALLKELSVDNSIGDCVGCISDRQDLQEGLLVSSDRNHSE